MEGDSGKRNPNIHMLDEWEIPGSIQIVDNTNQSSFTILSLHSSPVVSRDSTKSKYTDNVTCIPRLPPYSHILIPNLIVSLSESNNSTAAVMISRAQASLATRSILSTAKPSLLRKTSPLISPKLQQDGSAWVRSGGALIVNVRVVFDRDEDVELINWVSGPTTGLNSSPFPYYCSHFRAGPASSCDERRRSGRRRKWPSQRRCSCSFIHHSRRGRTCLGSSRLLQVTLGNSRQPKCGLLTISIRRQGGIVRDFELEFLPIMPPQQPHRAPRAHATRPWNTAGRSTAIFRPTSVI